MTETLDSGKRYTAFRVISWASAVLGVAAIGVYIGHELRARYKFTRRTPYDIFAHAGDSVATADYGVGI